MALHVALTHETHYRYDRRIGMGPQVIRLRPAPHCRTPILSYSLTLEPKTHFVNWQQDPFGNFLARVVLPEETDDFSVTVDLVADMAVINPFDFFVEESATEWPFAYAEELKKELGPYLEAARPGPLLTRHLAGIERKKQVTIDFLCDLNRQLRNEIHYLVRMEPGVQTPEETLDRAAGSCRDSAWLLVQILRNFGLAARFVSGYLIQLTPDVKALDGPVGAEADFTDLHAWAEVYLPGAGWIGLDADLGPACRRGTHSARCHAEPVERGADLRQPREGRGRVQPQDGRGPHPRDAARHQALQRRHLAHDPRQRPGRSTSGWWTAMCA